MNSAEIVRRLYRERQEWRDSGDGPELSWTVRGIDIALRVVHTYAKQEHMKALDRRPRLNRRIAGELFRAVTQAINYLSRGDRSRAVEELVRARAEALATLKPPKEAAHGNGK